MVKSYRGIRIRIRSGFSLETIWARKEQSDVFKVLKLKYHQPKIQFPAKLSFKSESEINTFWGKQKLRECVTTYLPCKKY